MNKIAINYSTINGSIIFRDGICTQIIARICDEPQLTFFIMTSNVENVMLDEI
jgi:hypothetical protein